MEDTKIKKWITWKGKHIPIGEDGKIIKINQKYTEKDINKLYSDTNRIQGTSRFEQEVRGYELNGIYLLKKKVYGYKNMYEWIINDKEDKVPHSSYNGVEWVIRNETKGNIIKVDSFKEGKEKLIQLANKKNKKEE